MKRLLLLLIWFVITLVLKIPSKFSFGLVVLTIFASVVTGLAGGEGFALRLMTYAYGLGVIGMISYLREIYQDAKK